VKTTRTSDNSQGFERARQRVKAGSPRAVATILSTVTLLGAVLLGSAWWFVRGVDNAVVSRDVGNHEPIQASLLSARRVPGVLSDDVRFGNFQSRLNAFVARLPNQSCFVVDVEGRRLVSTSSGVPFLPASNMKVLVASVALEVLGPDFRFVTEVHGKVVDGVVMGDLVFVGGGDPVLQSEGYGRTLRYPNAFYTSTQKFVDALRERGVSRIAGSIVGDESRYDTERWAPTLGLGIRVTEVGPLGALMVNDGSVLGDPLKADNPALSASREFYRVLTEAGVVVDGFSKTAVVVPETEPLVSVESEPLSNLIVDVLSNSDNNATELLLKEIGLKMNGLGTRESGIDVVRRTLEKRGLDVSSLVMVDGAGLDRGNRLPCDLLQAVLVSDDGSLFNGMAVAGRTGTLKDLFIGNPVEGRLRGKTGTLTGAKALTGLVPYAENQSIAYTLILNGPNVANQSYYRPLWNTMGDIFSTLSSSPSIAEIAPFSR